MFDASMWSRRARYVIAAVVAAVAMLGWPSVASAHTAFESSSPSDGAVIEGPLTEIVLNFTNPAEPAGDGFELLDPTGQIRTPTSIDETDGTSFVLSFEPSLTAGTYGVRWQVRAGDAHPIDGSFSFEVTEPAVTTTVPSPTTTPVEEATPSTTAPTTTAPPASAAVTTAPPTTAVATTTAPPSTVATDSNAALEAFLNDSGSDDDGSALGRIGRAFTFLGLIFGLGGLAALVWVVRGSRDELLNLSTWIRLGGLAIATGGVLELAALESTQSGGLLDLLDTKPGIAAGAKIVGGLAVLIGLHPGAGRVTASPQALSAAVATDVVQTPGSQGTPAPAYRWEPTARAWLGLAGFVVVLASFWFDGHTVTMGPWAVHAIANSVHLIAASVWAGGVFVMTVVVWMRRRATEPTGLAAMVVRFSTPATASLIAVTAAGVAMAFMILDRPADLFDTDWGRLLLAKTAAVAVAAGLGAFNHFRLRPALERSPGDPALARELRRTLTVESAVFVVVVLVTVWLVAAAM